jgi:hypothetical protein
MSEVTFKLQGKDYELPNYLSIGDYVKIFKIKDLFEDEYMKAKVVNLLTDCPMETLIDAENHKVDFLATTIFAMVPLFKNKLEVKFALGGQFFFINFGKTYLSFTPLSLMGKVRREWTILKMIWTHRKLIWILALNKGLDGTSSSIEYQKTYLKTTIKSLKKMLLKS